MNILAIPTFQRLATSSCASLLLFVAAIAQAEQRPTMTTHVPEAVSSGLAPFVGHLSSTQRLSLAISLPLRSEAELDDLLQQLYDPQSPSYHQYLSVQEFAARFGPVESDYAAVLSFAEANGLAVNDTFGNRMVVDVEGPAANIESAFHVSLGIYQHPTENRNFYAPDREPTPDIDVPL
jgi:subtilase family serine protease